MTDLIAQATFRNNLCIIHSIDALSRLTTEQNRRFLANPVSFFLRADDQTAAIIWREIELRQRGV